MSSELSGTGESAAKKGIFAGALLTVVEIVGAVISGSLGLLASAFNTLIDFFAAVITFFAIKEGGKPPDEVHMYGHEKIESVAAVAEILLLFIVCIWVTYNAFLRLMSGRGDVEMFWIALGTNFVSILIDTFAYRNLVSSRKRRSEAIEAGALHFLSDLLVAVVVIIGLLLYRFGVWYADSVAALAIVAYITYSGLRLVRDSFATLTDAAPKGVINQLRMKILDVEGVKDCHDIRVRRAGSRLFVDAHVEIEGQIPLGQAHSVASRIEEEIKRVFPYSDVLIHTEPYVSESPLAAIRDTASQFAEVKGVHGITVKTMGESISISYHLELGSGITLKAAHETADRLERLLKDRLKNVSTITSHLEPASELLVPDYDLQESSRIQRQITQISQSSPEIRSLHKVQIMAHDGKYSITLHCTIEGSMTLDQAHEIATKIEEKIRKVDGKIEQVTIHCEPEDSHEAD